MSDPSRSFFHCFSILIIVNIDLCSFQVKGIVVLLEY